MHTIFIDGAQGTTGLRLGERLAGRKDIEVLELSETLRKDSSARREAMSRAQITFLCLPDDAARESVCLAEGTGTRIIDASTAHRTEPGWVYGFPELNPTQRSLIAQSNRVAVPGCHASGFAAISAPLRQNGILPADALLSCFSLTGYSGGGKAMIEEYAQGERSTEYDSPRHYALGQSHKHLREMIHVCKLENAPVFVPVVGDFMCGMAVSVPLHLQNFSQKIAADELNSIYKKHYAHERAIKVIPPDIAARDGFLATNTLDGRDDMELVVAGNDDRVLVTARFDNLGKGASGAAVQCMNLMLGLDEFASLSLGK